MEMDFENWANLPSLAEADSLTVAETVSGILDAKKARDIAVLHVKDHNAITDYVVLATGTSFTHVKALAGEVEFRMGERGVKPLHEDGRNTRNWQVVDYGTVMVHIFDRESREFYKLDKLFKDTDTVSDKETI